MRAFTRTTGYQCLEVRLGGSRVKAAKAPVRRPREVGSKSRSQRPPAPEHLALTADGNFAVIAAGNELLVIALAGQDKMKRPRQTRLTVKSPVRMLATATATGAVLAALADGSLVEVDAGEANVGAKSNSCIRVLAGNLGGEPHALIATARGISALVEDCAARRHFLVSVVPGGSRHRRAPLPFANITAAAAIDPERSDRLLIVDSRHGAHLVGFPTASDADTLDVEALGEELRATAAAALDSEWLAVARKGGEIILQRAMATNGTREQRLADECRRLRAILARCGCACHTRPSEPHKPKCDCCDECGYPPGTSHPNEPGDGGTPGGGTGGRPGGGTPPPGQWPVDDEPCHERKRALLSWSVARLAQAGAHLLALSSGNRRMAVLDRDLNLLFERYLGTHGSLVAAAATGSDQLVTVSRSGGSSGRLKLERWSLGDYVRNRSGTDLPLPSRRKVDPDLAKPVLFRGRKAQPATPNPHLNVCVFTVTEPSQPFGDPDQAKMQAQLQPNVYDKCIAYYQENSFHTLTPQYSVFGVHIGAARPPLVLPRSFASYFYDDYRPGGIEAIMPGNWATPPVFDGGEAMIIRTEPAFGTSKDYPVPFVALWTTHTHNGYPVQVNFAGTETLQLQVVDRSGANHLLNVTFAALALSHAQGDNEVAFLNALGTHVTNAIRAAETAAGTGVLIQDLKFRRIRIDSDDTHFGRLQGQFRVAGGGAQKGRITLTPPGPVPAPLIAIGLDGVGKRSGVLTSAVQVGAYLGECVNAARFDSGEGLGLNDPQLSATVETEENVSAQTLRARINLETNKGGSGAQITLVSSSELGGLGWDAATAVPGSESTANNRNTMRYHQDLANDVFTAALNHLRATTTWVRSDVEALFAGFDAMMIGFVGACPATVPVADRWNSADAVDFARLRMFVRVHQAADLNPPMGEAPVTMGPSLLIGQRFNQFDPGVMSHECGHALGLPDLYYAEGFRDDVDYVDDWCQMAGSNYKFNHFCAWSKWAVGWIIDDPSDPNLNRAVEVPMPAPSGTTETEAWLCPVEYWDNNMRADIVAAVGNGLPVGQMMKVALGSDGGVIDLIEFRARGVAYSQYLPATPSVVVTNVLQPGTDRRWAVNGLYRRDVHLLNRSRILQAVGQKFDFAGAPEFPVKGTKVELMELQSIRGGSIPIARVKVEREAAEFIDLFFQDNVPSWRSPDIWVDWAGDNADPNVARIYPEGTPTDQGETVRYPSSGTEKHFLVVRPHNAGNVKAEDVKIRWFICDPPGAGDDNRWVQRDTQTLPAVDGGTWVPAPFIWNVGPETHRHQCIRGEIIDWTIPTTVDPATGDTLALGSDDVILQNNLAQKNVSEFEAAT